MAPVICSSVMERSRINQAFALRWLATTQQCHAKRDYITKCEADAVTLITTIEVAVCRESRRCFVIFDRPWSWNPRRLHAAFNECEWCASPLQIRLVQHPQLGVVPTQRTSCWLL
jgi:hypothetical protein